MGILLLLSTKVHQMRAMHSDNAGCSSILVQWTTRDAGTPTVQYGTASGRYTQNVTGGALAVHGNVCA